jgi:ABC-type nickel/cobalt efflux system permease component RcnA
MGFAGGLVPSPSALVVLLGAVALGRTWLGVVLVVAYGAGMAMTLTGVGLALARARDRVASYASLGPRMQRVVRAGRLLPLASAAVILTVGVVIAAQGLNAAV